MTKKTHARTRRRRVRRRRRRHRAAERHQAHAAAEGRFPGRLQHRHRRSPKFPAGGAAGRHTHPGVETGYVLEGELDLLIDGQPPKKLKAGDSYQIPAGVGARRQGSRRQGYESARGLRRQGRRAAGQAGALRPHPARPQCGWFVLDQRLASEAHRLARFRFVVNLREPERTMRGNGPKKSRCRAASSSTSCTPRCACPSSR